MSHLDLPELSELTGRTRELAEDAIRRWGYLPNIVRAYALAPDVMEAEDVWAKGVMYRGLLPRRLKEAIATAVSVTNRCGYCAGCHAHAYTLAGGDVEGARACLALDLSGFDERERAAIELARRATSDARAITGADIAALRSHFSAGEVVEIAAVIQQFMGYNWFVTILGLELEEANPFKGR